MNLVIDFEGKSDVPLIGPSGVGPWMYSRHPSTDVLCVGWGDNFTEGQWRQGEPPPRALFQAIKDAETVSAHNSFFEVCVWKNICVRRYGWPEVPPHKWRCSATKAASCSIPRNLGDAGRAIKLKVVKNDSKSAGKLAMQRLARSKGKESDWPLMLGYNMDDVYAELALDEALPNLTPQELEVWQMSERMNLRGVRIDRKGCEKAVQLTEQYAVRLTSEFQQLTGLEAATQRQKFEAWMDKQGFPLENTQAATLDDFIRTQPLDGVARRACEIVRELGRSSVTKYRACLRYADVEDDRLRGSFLYHGAHTARWSGKDTQLQNFKRDCPWNMEQAWRDVHEYDLDQLEVLYGEPLEFFGAIARGAIVASPDTSFYAGDYAQIEARKVFWLSSEKKGLSVFERGEDMYIEMASTIWGRKLIKCKENEEKRYVGKHAILSLGFGSGYIKFLMHLRDLGAPAFSWQMVCDIVPPGWRNATLNWIMSEGWAEVKRRMPKATRRDAEELVLTKWIVDKYRAQYKDTVVAFWYETEDAAKRALKNPGQTFTTGRLPGKRYKTQFKAVSFHKGPQFLNCKLPSGRIMRYLDAKLDDEGHITYIDPVKKIRTSTYGGKLVENIVQASSRDIMAERMLVLEQYPDYKDLVMTIHDEVIAEVKNGRGSLQEYLDILAVRPKWCLDLPIKVEGWQGPRYKKG